MTHDEKDTTVAGAILAVSEAKTMAELVKTTRHRLHVELRG